MEGTRNERVVILTVSYLIGFVTAYIAFGLTQLDSDFKYENVRVANTASVISAATDDVHTPGIAAMTKEGLVLIKNNQQRILSATMAAEDGILPDGYHTNIADYSVSPDGDFVYFCEVPSEEVDACRPYLYSVAEDTVYPIKEDGERIAFAIDHSTAHWNEDGTLSFE